MTWLGVGNVDGVLLRVAGAGGAERLVVRSGVLGGQLPHLEAARLPVAPGDTLIFATDGVRGGFAEDFTGRPTIHLDPDRILAQHAKPTDDALVVVARYLGNR